MTIQAWISAALRVVAPELAPDMQAQWLAALAPVFAGSGIVTPRRVAAFMGQVALESAGFAELEERLAYSAGRIQQVWPSRFPTIADAAPYSFRPEALANHVYAGRLGNGNEAGGDGWMFRGRGLVQLTGRASYTAFAAAIGQSLAATAAYLETPAGAARCACWLWTGRRLNSLADIWDLRTVTLRLNGGLIDLQARIQLCESALRALGGDPPLSRRPAPPDPDTSADALNAAELAATQGV
jgi:putative chitinase